MNLPNRLTIARFFASMVIILLMVFPYQACGWTPTEIGTSGFNLVDLLCCVLFVLASITDTLDGNIARSQHLISDFGKFMDPLADKALVNSALVLLAIYKPYNAAVANDPLSANWMILSIFVVLMILRDIAVDGLRFVAASQGEVLAASYWGKAKTVAQMIAIPFVFVNGFPFTYVSELAAQIFSLVLIGIACVLSLISGGIYLHKGNKYFRNIETETCKKDGE
jgi:CDP-diacylglycerol--glycerol-3-phosphate 3-phosphatidyltransferase